MSKNILFILEGERTEPRFLKRIATLLRTYSNYEIFSYRTNIHKMVEGMINGKNIDNNLDFIEYLKSCKTNKDDQSVLERKYSDIFLFFDMDPQDQLYDPDVLFEALNYFNDSTENGKLYINYPMFESFKHIKNLNDLSYLDTVVDKKDIANYKKIANEEGLESLSDISKIDESTMLKVIILNLRKASMILGNGTDIPSMDDYEESSSQYDILKAQLDEYTCKERLYVLNTCLFNTIDYNPARFFEKIAFEKI